MDQPSRPSCLHGALALAVIVACVVSARDATAGWPRPHLSLGGVVGQASFGNLVDFLAFQPNGNGPETIRAQYADADFRGFRVGLRLHPDLEVTWTRQTGDSRYRYWLDGVEAVDGLQDGVEVRLAPVDLRVDVLGFTFRPQAWRRWGIGPVLNAGMGWIDQRAQGDFRPPQQFFGLDWDDTDLLGAIGLGLEGRWHFLRAALEWNTLHWRFEPADGRFPRETVHATLPSLRIELVY